MEIVYRNLSELRVNPKNPRKGSREAIERLAESIKENPAFFEARPILVSDRTGEFVIIGGERRSEAAAKLGMEKVPTILLQGLTEAEEDEIMIKDNTHAGEWDDKKLQEITAKWGGQKVLDWGVDKKLLRPDKEEYTHNLVQLKLSEFIYEPKGEMPAIEDCIETKDMDGVLKRLKGIKGLTKEERRVLEICAYRFCTIDFSKMAEYYAHASKPMQRAMEDNFLVIVDFEKARERGYVKMVTKLAELCDKEIADEK